MTFRARPLVRLVACCTALAALLPLGARAAAAPPAPVPNGVANCQWLKLTATAWGIELLPDDAGLGPHRSLRAVCYMQLVYTAPDGDNPYGRYEGQQLCATDAVNWAMSGMNDSFSGKALPDGNVITDDNLLTFTNEGSDVIQGYGSQRLLIGVDKKTQAFRSATLQTLGGELIDSSFDFEDFLFLYGSYQVRGSSIPVAKVPPQALALVAGGPCSP